MSASSLPGAPAPVSMLSAALRYREGDSPLRRPTGVFPVCRPKSDSPSGCSAAWHADGRRYPRHLPGKTPMVRWTPYQARIASEAEWSTWDERFAGRYNLGLATGRFPGFVVLDLDSPAHAKDGDGPDGRASLRAAGISPPATSTACTGSGGRQLFYAYPPDAPAAGLRNFAGRWPGVDARGDGGYVVLPPSVGVKGPYTWEPATTESAVAPCPAWLLAAFGATSDGEAMRTTPEAGPSAWADHWATPCCAGCRNSTVARLAGHLAAHGIEEDEAAAVLRFWNVARCTPPLSAEEVTSTVASIYRTHGRHDPTAGVAPAPEIDAATAFGRLTDSVAALLASADPATRCRGAAQAFRSGMAPNCILACLLAMNGGDAADARRALRWAMRTVEVKTRAI